MPSGPAISGRVAEWRVYDDSQGTRTAFGIDQLAEAGPSSPKSPRQDWQGLKFSAE